MKKVEKLVTNLHDENEYVVHTRNILFTKETENNKELIKNQWIKVALKMYLSDFRLSLYYNF